MPTNLQLPSVWKCYLFFVPLEGKTYQCLLHVMKPNPNDTPKPQIVTVFPFTAWRLLEAFNRFCSWLKKKRSHKVTWFQISPNPRKKTINQANLLTNAPHSANQSPSLLHPHNHFRTSKGISSIVASFRRKSPMVDWPDLSFVPCRRRYNDFKTDNVDGRLDYWIYNDYKALYKEILLPWTDSCFR